MATGALRTHRSGRAVGMQICRVPTRGTQQRQLRVLGGGCSRRRGTPVDGVGQIMSCDVTAAAASSGSGTGRCLEWGGSGVWGESGMELHGGGGGGKWGEDRWAMGPRQRRRAVETRMDTGSVNVVAAAAVASVEMEGESRWVETQSGV